MCNRNSGNLFLTGFMGAGKTTVGRLLARRNAVTFIDLDEQIVSLAGKSIREIFAQDGETAFRDLEEQVLKAQSTRRNTVFATGGGIVMRETNRMLMHQLGQVVYLRAQWETLQARLEGSRNRPLADTHNGWEPVQQLLQSRQPWYEQADLVIDSDALDARQIVTALMTQLPAGKDGKCTSSR